MVYVYPLGCAYFSYSFLDIRVDGGYHRLEHICYRLSGVLGHIPCERLCLFTECGSGQGKVGKDVYLVVHNLC